jgi:hypothetical protein
VPAETAHADTRSLVTRLETAAGAVVGRPRIAAMTPTTAPLPEGLREERVSVRLSDTSLGEVVRLLHGLESADPPLPVARLELRKHTDDPRHFEATVEVAQVGPARPRARCGRGRRGCDGCPRSSLAQPTASAVLGPRPRPAAQRTVHHLERAFRPWGLRWTVTLRRPDGGALYAAPTAPRVRSGGRGASPPDSWRHHRRAPGGRRR